MFREGDIRSDLQTDRLFNQPPPVLKGSVVGLEAQYERKGYRLENAIDSVLEKILRLRKEHKNRI